MCVANISKYCSDLKSRILEVITLYQHYQQVIEGLEQENVSQKFKDYKLEDGILLFRDKFNGPNTRELRNIVLKET